MDKPKEKKPSAPRFVFTSKVLPYVNGRLVDPGVYTIPGVGILAVDAQGNTCVIHDYDDQVFINRCTDDRKPWLGMRRIQLK